MCIVDDSTMCAHTFYIHIHERCNTMSAHTNVDIATLFTNATYSPYEMCKAVNNVLRVCGIEKVLPPQMFYIYTSADKTYIATIAVDGKRRVERDIAIAWCEKYILRLLSR